MNEEEMAQRGNTIKDIVLKFATKMKWIEREDCSLLKEYVRKLDEEILRRKNEARKKATPRRSVCLRKAPSWSSSDDDDDDDDGILKDDRAAGDGVDDHRDGDGNMNGVNDSNGVDEESGVDNNNDESEDDDNEESNHHDPQEPGDQANESDDEDDFDAFIRKVNANKLKIISSDEEDRSSDEDDFIDDSELKNIKRSVWQTPRKSEVIDLSSDSDGGQDDSPDERRKEKPSVKKKPPTPAPSKSGILSAVRTPKTPHGTVTYRREYKKLRDEIANDLFNLFNETVFDNRLPEDLQIVFNKRMTKTAGFCYYHRDPQTKVRSSKIEIAEKVCDSVERLRDTIIHELCHAAAWILNNSKCGHGSYWKHWATKAHRAHPDLPPISRCHQFDVECRYTFKCVNPYCGRSYGRHSKSLKKCPECLGSLEVFGRDGVTPLKQKEPSKFALFVKEEYRITKQDNPQMNHGQIMKLLGQNFSKLSTK